MKTTLLLPIFLLLYSIHGLQAQNQIDSFSKALDFEPISKEDFNHSSLVYFEMMNNRAVRGFKALQLTEITYCDQICESYLIDESKGDSMLLPSSFDQGILGMLFSPSENYLLLYSSYDGPDYINYYDYRAEIIVYEITPNKGLKALSLDFNFYAQDWSIEDLTWINDSTIGLKTYAGDRNMAGVSGGFEYVKAPIK